MADLGESTLALYLSVRSKQQRVNFYRLCLCEGHRQYYDCEEPDELMRLWISCVS